MNKGNKTRALIKKLVLYAMLFIVALHGMPGSKLNCAKKVYATSKSAQEAISWVKSKLNTQVNGGECVGLITAYYTYLGVSPVRGNGKDYATNSLPVGWSRVQGGTPQLGDILVYSASNTNGYGHVAIFESTRSTYHQNFNNNRTVQHVNTINYNGFTNPYWGYIRPNWSTMSQISHNPEGNLESIEGGLNGASIRGWVFDRDSLSSSVPIHVYMDGVYAGAGVADKKRADVNNAHGCGEYHGFDFMLPIKSSGTHALEVYAINIGADGQPSGQGNLLMGGTSVSIVVDETPPVISDVRILDLDSSGYTIECKATDNRGIDRVQCPTWTVANGQDDLQKDWWTDTSVKATDKGNGVFQFRVNISEHNSERGLYITHIYAYDEAGNYAVHKVEDVEVLEDSGTIAPGDINQDGKIDGKDISMLLQYRLKKRELTEEQIADGDVYKDGKIDGKDVSRLLQYRLGKISSLN